MLGELGSDIVSITNLAGYWHVRTISLHVLVELSSGEMLEFFPVAYIAPEFGTVELSVNLELSQSFPNYLGLSIYVTSVGEFTKINTVLKNFVYGLKELTPFLTVRTACVNFPKLLLAASNNLLCSSSIPSCRYQFFFNLLADLFIHILMCLVGINITYAFYIAYLSFCNLNLAVLAE